MSKEENMFGMRVLRTFKGPASHLLSLQDSQNRHFVAIAFYDRYRNHSAITESLNGLMGFLQAPVAKGITPLHAHDEVRAGFVYETGKVKSVAEMIRQASDLGLKPGPRAGIQLIVEVADILRTAVRIAESYAIFSHGGLTPWRIMVRPDGKLQLIGFAIPQIEILDFSRNPNNLPSEDSFRYVPPERLSAQSMEDISSDLFSLALIGFEVMTTRPVYDGSASIIQESASRADVSLRLNQALMDGLLDRNTHDFLDRALRLHPEDRFPSVDEMIREGRRILGFSQLQGMSLFELVGQTDVQIMRRSQEISKVEEATGMFDRSVLQEIEKERISEITSKIKEEAPVSAAELKPERISDVATSTKATAPTSSADLLRLLRESQINIPTADSAPTPVFPDVKSVAPSEAEIDDAPPASAKSSLLSALRESMSSAAQMKPERIPTPPLKEEPQETGKSKLAGLISKPKREATVEKPPKEEHREQIAEDKTEEPMAVEKSEDKAAALKDSLLRSLISKTTRDTPVQKDNDVVITEAASVSAQLDGSLSLGDPLEGHSEDDDLDDAATSIMTRPAAVRKAKQSSAAKEEGVVNTRKEKPPEVHPAVRPASGASSDSSEQQNPLRPKIEIDALPKGVPQASSTPHSSVRRQIGDLHSVPLILKNSSPSNKGESFVFSIGEGKGAFTLILPMQATSASVVYRKLLHRVLPIRTDLTGQLTSMYRLSKKGQPVSGLQKMSFFEPKRPILLYSVPNSIRIQTFEIWKDEELLRFTAPVGIAVPVYSLLDHLTSWLRLEKSEWQMSVGDIVLEPANILFDVESYLDTHPICVQRKRGS